MGRIKTAASVGSEKLQRRIAEKPMLMEDVADRLYEHYRTLDVTARKDFMRTALTMYANYENRWSGEVNLLSGNWVDSTKSSVDVDFTIPLLTSLVDTHTTFYTKTRPQYIARPLMKDSISRRVAKMCEEIAGAELDRMLTYSNLQRESQYMTLATVSYRRLDPDIVPHSPQLKSLGMEMQDTMSQEVNCPSCGYKEQRPIAQEVEEPGDSAAMDQDQDTCPECLGQMQQGSTTMGQQEVPVETVVRLPRLKLTIPNPVYIQTDFNASDFKDAKFAIKRKRIPKHTAEFYYQIDLTSADTAQSSIEAQIDERKQRESLGHMSAYLPSDLGSTPSVDRWEKVEEIEFWLDPCEYGLYFVDGSILGVKYPEGMYLKIVGNVLVSVRPAVKNEELIRVQQGVRPASNTGMGMVHLAELNELINNEISLEYSILMTYGFPLQLLRGKYLKELPAALQTFVIEKIPDTVGLDTLIHREQPANTSGMLGILSQRVEGYMQQIGGTFTSSGMTPQMKQMMGTATGASAIQEMMSDRMGLSVQMRVEADIQTLDAILRFFRKDTRNRQWLIDSGYDEVVVDYFYKNEPDGIFFFEAAKGTDEPSLDAVNTFKVQSFASLVAPLTGVHQLDPALFYDIVDQLGKALNLPMGIGTGRKERNLADARIDRLKELYRQEKDNPITAQMDPVALGDTLFKAVMTKERMMIESITQTRLQNAGAIPQSPEEQMVAQQTAQLMTAKVEAYLYDYNALQEAYSDWLQSDEGQTADMPMQIAVGLLFTYSLDMMDKRKQMDLQTQLASMQAAGAMTGDPTAVGEQSEDPTNPPGPVKRDGTSGPGRPREAHIPTE